MVGDICLDVFTLNECLLELVWFGIINTDDDKQ